MSGNPVLSLTRDREQLLKVIEAERGSIATRACLRLERTIEWSSEERTLLTDIL